MALTLWALICIRVVIAHADAATTKADSTTSHPRLAKKIMSVRPETDDQGLKVYIVADGNLKDYDAFRVLRPHRLVIDLPGVQCSLRQKILLLDSLLVKNIQFHTSYKDKVRVVFNLFPIAELPYVVLSKDNQLIVFFGSVAGSPIVKQTEKIRQVPAVSTPEKTEELTGTYVEKPALTNARKITAVEVEMYDQCTEAHIVGDGRLAQYAAFHLSDPARLVVDVFGVQSVVGKEKLIFSNPLVKGVRLGTSYEDQVRLVFDLVSPDGLPYQIVPKDNRLIVFLKQKSDTSTTKPAGKVQSALPPSPAELAQENPLASAPPGKIILHISSFKQKINAEKEVQRLNKYGYKTFMAAEEVLGGSWLRVYIGIFDDEQTARRIGSELKGKGLISYFKPFKTG